ncbi:MAG: transcription antitermination factor NusB [Phycisphaerales bacterium JB047]
MPRPGPHTRRPPKNSPTPVQNARDAAYRNLSAHAERYPDLLPQDINSGDLDARDASLAHAIVDASIRRWRTLEFVLESVSGHQSHELEPRMRAVLLGGTAQLLLLDRVPPHAILDESVSWAKRYIRQGAGGMVNAVLRKVAQVRGEQLDQPWDHHTDTIPLSEGGSLVLNGIELPEHGRRRLGVACSLPNALLRRWETLYEDPTAAAMHTIVKPPTIICTKYTSDIDEDAPLLTHDSPDHRVFGGHRQELLTMLRGNQDLWVQDPASTSTLANLHLESPPTRVIDLCAGHGTKTRQLRAMYPEAEIIACEIDKTRLQSLNDQFRDDPQVRIVPVKALDERALGWANLVLADVPCSNTGVLSRRVEARSRPIDAQLKRLVATQREILKQARTLLEPQGTLVYATCSVEVEENEAQTQWASEHLGLDLVELQRVDASGQPGDEPSSYQDASFAAYLRAPSEKAAEQI